MGKVYPQRICIRCGEQYENVGRVSMSQWGTRLYCSNVCKVDNYRGLLTFNCKHCDKEIQAYAKDKTAYCSWECFVASKPEPPNKGIPASPEVIAKIKAAPKRQNYRHSEQTKKKISQSNLKTWSKMFPPDLRQQRSVRELEIRKRPYRELRTKIYERDDYTCQLCNERGGKLVMDHIKPWCLYPELRYDESNLRTLCFDCHKLTPTYGVKALIGGRI